MVVKHKNLSIEMEFMVKNELFQLFFSLLAHYVCLGNGMNLTVTVALSAFYK